MLETVRAAFDTVLILITAATVALDWPQLAAMAAFAYWVLRIMESETIQRLIKNERICKIIQAVGLLALEQAIVKVLERFGITKPELDSKVDEIDSEK